MLRTIASSFAFAALLALATPASAQDMSGEDLQALLKNGLTLELGGPGEGYQGKLRLEADGTGAGSAVSDSGETFDITGTWTIEGDEFCRQWKFDDYEKVCETWRRTGLRKAEVLVGGEKIGLNAW